MKKAFSLERIKLIEQMDLIDKTIFDFIDKVVYINLEKRSDRRTHMESETSIFGNKVIRYEAIECERGTLGCTKSHIGVLKMAILNNWRNVLVLEDDIKLNTNQYAIKEFVRLSKSDFDVILLGGTRVRFEDITFKLNHANCTHAYIVNNHYFHNILDNFKQSAESYEAIPNNRYQIDVYWNSLIAKDNWFITIPNLMYQIEGYSDVDNKVRNMIDRGFMLTRNEFVKRAIFGTTEKHIDATNKIQILQPSPKKYNMHRTLLTNDPCDNIAKVLTIEYLDGSIQTVPENTLLIIRNTEIKRP